MSIRVPIHGCHVPDRPITEDSDDTTIRCNCGAICETAAEEQSELCADCQWAVIQGENE